jgi:phosphate transport system substrate-binding protein
MSLLASKQCPATREGEPACGADRASGFAWAVDKEEDAGMIKASGRLTRALLALVVLGLIGVACGGGDDAGASGGGAGAGENVTGEITISGSSTVEPISAANGEKFGSLNPEVAISVEGPGTGDGFELFCNGETDISDASRPIDTAEEAPLCKKNGIEYIELKVGIDGIAVLTSPENTAVECLNFHDLYALLGPESEGFEQWSDANQLAQELDGETHAPYPDAELAVVAPGEESGTYDSFGELALEDIAYEERGIEEDAPVIRPDYQASPNDNVIIEGVSGNPTSLGWVGYAFYVQNQSAVRAIPIAESGDNCIEPNEETIASNEYPISRFLYIYVNKAKLEENPALEPFVDFYLSDEGLASVSEVGYVDLAEEDLQATLDVWESKQSGTQEG